VANPGSFPCQIGLPSGARRSHARPGEGLLLARIIRAVCPLIAGTRAEAHLPRSATAPESGKRPSPSCWTRMDRKASARNTAGDQTAAAMKKSAHASSVHASGECTVHWAVHRPATAGTIEEAQRIRGLVDLHSLQCTMHSRLCTVSGLRMKALASSCPHWPGPRREPTLTLLASRLVVSATGGTPPNEGLRLQGALGTGRDRRIRRDVPLSTRLLQPGRTRSTGRWTTSVKPSRSAWRTCRPTGRSSRIPRESSSEASSSSPDGRPSASSSGSATASCGSHIRLRHVTDPSRKPLTIPDHRTLKPGLLRHLMRDAQVDPEEFRGLLDQ
jgi:HicA toxin of bacterial toxin-antitoxin,